MLDRSDSKDIGSGNVGQVRLQEHWKWTCWTGQIARTLQVEMLDRSDSKDIGGSGNVGQVR